MIVAALLLAQSFFITRLNGEPEAYIATPYYDMPSDNIQIPAATRIIDNQLIGNPTLQPAYEYPGDDNGFPIRSVGFRQTVPIQERLQMQEIETGMAADRARLSALQSETEIRRANFDYDTQINRQAERGMYALRELNPQSDDFITQLAAVQTQYPLAFQNPGFNQSVGRLKQTYDQTQQAKQVIERQAAEDERRAAERRESVATSLRTQAASFGEPYLQEYDSVISNAVASGQAVDPAAAFARIAQKAARDKDAYEAEQKRLAVQNRPLTNDDYLANIRTVGQLRKDLSEDKITAEEANPQIEALNQQIRTYETQQGIRRDSRPTPTAAPSAIDAIPEGGIVRQNGVRFRKTNGQLVPIQ